MLDSRVSEFPCVVILAIESHDGGHPVLVEIVEILFGTRVRGVGLGAGAAEREEPLRHQPAQVSSEHISLLFEFLDIEIIEIEKSKCSRFSQTVEAVFEGDGMRSAGQTSVLLEQCIS